VTESLSGNPGPNRFDAVTVGAGPAGLSAALILGRSRRRVLVCDRGQQRNLRSRQLNGYLTRDGIPPIELRRLGRDELTQYDGVAIMVVEVTSANRFGRGFELTLADESRVFARKVLLATGVLDDLPDIEGFARFYGRSVHHCPYCDGWEVRDQPLAIYGRGELGKGMALELTGWSRDLVLCTDGPAELTPHDRARLARHGIALREEPIAALEGTGEALEHIRFITGEWLPRRALFFHTTFRQASDLATGLGCILMKKGVIETEAFEWTVVPGLYVAGDASRHVQLSIVAAAEGAEAAFAINTKLLREDLAERENDPGHSGELNPQHGTRMSPASPPDAAETR